MPTQPLTRAIGLMSGTSMDGVDVAFVETDGAGIVELGPTGFFPYTVADRSVLRAALAEAVGLDDRRARPGALATAEAVVTARHAEAVEAFLKAERLSADDVDLVGFHGQTVLHRPERRLTTQIGDGTVLAARLGIRVAYDFRAADVAAGGQGAPLVPAFHDALVAAADIERPVLIVNIGGVSNITFVQADADPIACDTGPGNALLDDLMWARTGAVCDLDGAAAAQGSVDAAALADLMRHPYFSRPLPKSLDRNAFSAARVAALTTEDAAATLTAFTAAGIASVCIQLPCAPKTVVVCGGGARNPMLMLALSQRFACKVCSAEDFGWSADAMEAQAFAYLAVRHTKKLPLTFPTTTGIPNPMTGGLLALP